MDIITTVRRDNEKYNDQKHFIDRINLLTDHGVRKFRFNIGKWDKEEFDQLEFDITAMRTLYGNRAEIILDLPYPGRKVRISTVNRKRVPIIAGQFVQIVSDLGMMDLAKENRVHVNMECIGDRLKLGDEIIYGDGDAKLKVTNIKGHCQIETVALQNLVLSHAKSLYFKDSIIFDNSFEDDIFQLVRRIGPEFIALSFLDSREQLTRVKSFIEGYNCKLMPKIETAAAVGNIDEITALSDSIMIGRGDLGFDVPLSKFAMVQNYLIERCLAAETPVYVATDVLDSLSHMAYPCRADLIDLECIRKSGAAGVVLTYSLIRSPQIVDAIRIIQEQGR